MRSLVNFFLDLHATEHGYQETWAPALVNRASMTGFVVFDYASRYKEAAGEMAGWIREGKLKSREDVVPGFETFPDTLLKLFRGENRGKLVLEVASA